MSRADRRQPKKPPPAAKAAAAQPRSARVRRTRTSSADDGLRSASFVFRHRVGNAVILLVLLVAATQLFTLQVSRAAGLRAEAAGQLKVTDVEEAVRGSIVDRNDDKLAFTIEARALTFQPARIQEAARRGEAEEARLAGSRPAAARHRHWGVRAAQQQARHGDRAEEAD